MDVKQTRGDGRKARPTAWAAVAAAAVLWSVLPVAAGAVERVALVIGNSAYEHTNLLRNPGNDARAVGEAFKRQGYSVTRLENADQSELRDALGNFKRAAGASDVAVVFYAGHGIEVDGRNFLVPVDAELAHDDDVEYQAVPLDLVMRAVRGARRLGLVMLDACRDNPFAKKMQSAGATRNIGRGLARVEPSGGTLVAYAAEDGKTAADGDGRNSPYTGALLAYLEEPGLEVSWLFRKVRAEVERTTGGSQTPIEYGKLPDEPIYLALAAAPIPKPKDTETTGGGTATTPLPPGDAAKAAYDTAKELGTVDAWRIVVEDFPGSTYAKFAQEQIAKLEGAKEPVVVAGGDPVDEETPAVPTPESVEQGLGLNLEQRRLVQMGLAAAGRDPGGVDGLFGDKTRRALSAWQASKEVEATGYLTKEQGELLVALGREAEERRKRAQTPGYEFRDCPGCPELVVVREGTYMMGSPSSEEGRYDDEGPVHRVRIGYRFAVGVKEVTRGEYARFVSESNHASGDSCRTYEDGEWEWRSGRNWKSPGFSQTDEHPVVCVSHEDAKAYVEWLSDKTGKAYRLLSEAEWEYVARGGTVTARYWGESGSGQCEYANGADASTDFDWRTGCNDGYARTSPVGRYEANGFGLHDVLGNVWEWVEDCWNESYAGAPSDGSAWKSGDCDRRVVRGGSWLGGPRILRSAHRDRGASGLRSSVVGFRVARTLTP